MIDIPFFRPVSLSAEEGVCYDPFGGIMVLERLTGLSAWEVVLVMLSCPAVEMSVQSIGGVKLPVCCRIACTSEQERITLGPYWVIERASSRAA